MGPENEMDITADVVTTESELVELYGRPLPRVRLKEIDHVSAHYRTFIEAAPFCAIATVGADGLDCSPRGDRPGFVRVPDRKTLFIPDRRGNNRLDTLRNIVSDPRVAILFLIPGCSETIRVIGEAKISRNPDLCASFTLQDKTPRSVLIVNVHSVYFHCAKAVLRSALWNQSSQIDRASLPSVGAILAELSEGRIVAEEHDRTAAERLRSGLY